MKMQNYRADLDGLRAFAILSVILFHFEIPFIGAGFSGVDIFFVISGFLICGTSLRNLESWSDIGDFYRRRIARLLPMVTLTSIVVMSLSAWLSTTLDSHEAFRTARYVAGFVSNNYLWSKADYFNSSGNINPFLHTWSLGIEEQFYLLIPVALLCFRRPVWIISLSIVVSILLATFAAKPPGAFYLLPCRAWELGAGALLVYAPAARSGRIGLLAVVTGLASIVMGLWWMSPALDQSPLFRLFPVLGAAGVIWGGSIANPLSRWIGWRPLALLGAASYSTYLIHWPLWIFGARPTEKIVGLEIKLGLVVIALCVGSLAFWFIERPLQHRLRNWSAAKVVSGMIGMIVLTLGISFAFAALVPKPFQFLPSSEQSGKCFLTDRQDANEYDRESCVPKTREEIWLLWGDSHAAHHYFGIKQAIGERAAFFQATNAGCSPLPSSSGEKRCLEFGAFVRDELIPATNPSVILLSSRWDRDEKMSGREELTKALRATLRALAKSGRRVVVFGRGPEFVGNVRLVLDDRRYDRSRSEKIWLPAETFAELNGALKSVSEEEGALFFDVRSEFCREDSCLAGAAGAALFLDTAHLSRAGSIIAADALSRQLSSTP